MPLKIWMLGASLTCFAISSLSFGFDIPIPEMQESPIENPQYVCWNPKSNEDAFAIKLNPHARVWKTMMSADFSQYSPTGIELTSVVIGQARTINCPETFAVSGHLFGEPVLTRALLNGCNKTLEGYYAGSKIQFTCKKVQKRKASL